MSKTKTPPVGEHRQPYPQQVIPLESIIFDNKNHRLPTAAATRKLDRLVDSIAVDGVLQPILVYPEGKKFHLVCGRRRSLAAERCKLAVIPASVMDHVPDEIEKTRLRSIENLDRDDLTPAERCVAIAEMVEAVKGDMQRAARDLGIDPGEVEDCCYVYHRLAPKVRSMLGEGLINLQQARQLAKCGDAQDQLDIAEDIQLDPHSNQRGQRVYTADEVRGMVENKKRSLRVVPWDLAAKFAGKRECTGCPHNTATDVKLFDTGPDEAEKGCCLNTECFEHKQAEAEKAQDQAVQKVRDMVKAKQVDKLAAAGMEVIREVSAEFLKPASVQRKVAQVFKPAAAKGAGAAGGRKAEPAKDPKEIAREKFADAFRKWKDNLENGIKSTEVVERLLVYMVLLRSSLFASLPNYYDPVNKEKPISPKLAALLDHAEKACAAEISTHLVAVVEDVDLSDFYEDLLDPAGPELCQRIAKVFSIDCGKPPVMEDFLPGAKPAAAASPFKPGDIYYNGMICFKIGNEEKTTPGGGLELQVIGADGKAWFLRPDQMSKAKPAEAKAFEEAWKKREKKKAGKPSKKAAKASKGGGH